jgi:uncharacterized protein YbaR (Trm112 family)/SAM-dependent methyltransferase
MKAYLLDILIDPKTKQPLQLHNPVYANDEIIGGILFDKQSKNTYPIKNGVPIFVAPNEATALNSEGLNYSASMDIRAKWKSVIRRSPTLTRSLQFIFDPAYVSHITRDRIVNNLPHQALLLNIGAGVKRFSRTRCINLDLEEFGNVDMVADGQEMPISDQSIDMVLVEYVVEHVPDSKRIVAEIYRILKPGGYIYATVPFIQAYHGNPDDYFRFTISGFRQFWKDFECKECKTFGGPTSALVCILKEYLAILLSFNNILIYSILSQVLIIPLFPLKFLDIALARLDTAQNMAFSILFLGQKPTSSVF